MKGGSETVSGCAALILETSLLPYNQGAPLIADVIAATAGLGFRCVDICEVARSNEDFIFQIDLLFVRAALFEKFTAAGLPLYNPG